MNFLKGSSEFGNDEDNKYIIYSSEEIERRLQEKNHGKEIILIDKLKQVDGEFKATYRRIEGMMILEGMLTTRVNKQGRKYKKGRISKMVSFRLMYKQKKYQPKYTGRLFSLLTTSYLDSSLMKEQF